MTLPSFFAASISAGVTASGGGAAATTRVENAAPASSAPVPASRPRRGSLGVFIGASSYLLYYFDGGPQRPTVLTLAQLTFEIPSSVGNRNDLHLLFQYSEPDCYAPLKSDRSKARQNVVTTPATLRKCRQTYAGRINAIQIAVGDLDTTLACDVEAQLSQVPAGGSEQDDLTRHAWRPSLYGQSRGAPA